MLDNCTLYAPVTPDDLPDTIKWKSTYWKDSGQTINWVGLLYGPAGIPLHITYYPDKEVIRIKGSLHKFYHGNNHCRFTYDECCEAILLLSGLLQYEVMFCEIKDFEFGFNLETKENPKKYISLISLIGKNGQRVYDTMENGNQISKNTTNWYFKLYSKTHEAEIKQNVLRIEMKRKHLTRFLPEIITVEDVLDEKMFKKLYGILYEKMAKLEIHPTIDYAPKPATVWELVMLLLINYNLVPILLQHIDNHFSNSTLDRWSGKISKSVKKYASKRIQTQEYLLTTLMQEFDMVMASSSLS
jgi:hypothetical protein